MRKHDTQNRRDAHGNATDEIDQGLDRPSFLLRAGQEAREAHDDDAHLDSADEHGQCTRREERIAKLFHLRDCGIFLIIPASERGSHRHGEKEGPMDGGDWRGREKQEKERGLQ